MHDGPLRRGQCGRHGEEEPLALEVAVEDVESLALVLGGAAEHLDRAVALGSHA